MSEIVSIEGDIVRIGDDDGKMVSVPIASLKFANPKVGDKVKVFKEKNVTIVNKVGESTPDEEVYEETGEETRINKHIFVWVFNFILGGFGVDRFVRGQIGTGVCKLLFGWLTCGIWVFVDWIIAMVKAYGSSFGEDEDFVFSKNGDYIK